MEVHASESHLAGTVGWCCLPWFAITDVHLLLLLCWCCCSCRLRVTPSVLWVTLLPGQCRDSSATSGETCSASLHQQSTLQGTVTLFLASACLRECILLMVATVLSARWDTLCPCYLPVCCPALKVLTCCHCCCCCCAVSPYRHEMEDRIKHAGQERIAAA
jgi:hypothetical protein